MRTSKLVRNMLMYLPIPALAIAAVAGLLIGELLYPASIESQSKSIDTQFPEISNDDQPLFILGQEPPCNPSYLYTSLPPKCRTSDGKFTSVPRRFLNIVVIPDDRRGNPAKK